MAIVIVGALAGACSEDAPKGSDATASAAASATARSGAERQPFRCLSKFPTGEAMTCVEYLGPDWLPRQGELRESCERTRGAFEEATCPTELAWGTCVESLAGGASQARLHSYRRKSAIQGGDIANADEARERCRPPGKWVKGPAMPDAVAVPSAAPSSPASAGPSAAPSGAR